MDENTIFLTDFHASDDTIAFAEATAYLRQHPGTTLRIPSGVYTLTSPLAQMQQDDILSGRYGANPQNILFRPSFPYTKGIDLSGIRNCRIVGDSAKLLVDGFMEPLSITQSRDLYICGIIIDHKRKPYTKGIVKEVETDRSTGKTVCLIATEEDIYPETPLQLRIALFDPETGTDITPYTGAFTCEYLSRRLLRLRICTRRPIPVGSTFYTVHTLHARPAIRIEQSENIILHDVTIHSQGGMGVVGNRCENITLRQLRVIPSEGHHFSTNTDATHFTSIKGTLRLENCCFQGQGDDGTNVHGYYQEIEKTLSDTACLLREKTPDGTHLQTLDYPDAGDLLELTDKDTLEVRDVYRVLSCTVLPTDNHCLVTLDHSLPEYTDRFVFGNATRTPRLEVIGCEFRQHYARGILIKCRDALIEGNHFRFVQGPAIVAAAETAWYEGISPANLVIRNNTVEHCALRWGEASGIVIKSDCKAPIGQSIFNVRIEDNRIDCPEARTAVFVSNTQNLTICRNVCRCSGEAIVCRDCREAVTDQNSTFG